MSWHAQFCMSQDVYDETMVESVEEGISWAKRVESERELTVSVFNESFRIDKPKYKQWGTGYFWLSMEDKT